MKYKLEEIPFVSEFYSYQNDRINNRVICTSPGEIKILDCEPEILEELLYHVDGKNTFGEIEAKFINRYPIDDIRNFLGGILKEEIIKRNQSDNLIKEEPKILVVGGGVIAETLRNYDHIKVSRFLKEHNHCNFDVAIFAPPMLRYSDMLSVNEKLYKLEKPYIQISFDGEKITVGPLVVPNKSACLECGISYDLKRLNSKVSNEEKVDNSDLKDLNYCFNLPKEFDSYKISYIVNILLDDIINFYNGSPSEFLDFQYFFDSNFPGYTKVARLPTTYCGFCNGNNKDYIKFDSNTMNFDYILNGDANANSMSLKASDLKYNVGGLRSKTEKETKDVLDEELNKFGAIVRIEPAYGNPFNDSNIIHCFNSSIEQSSSNGLQFLIREGYGAGKGLTKSQSYFSASFELLEHIGLQYTGNIPIVCAKYSDVKEIAIDLPYLAGTIMNKNTAFADFNENVEIDWVVATSLTTGGKKLVPAFLVFMFDVELKGALFGATSNGAAAGTTLEDAILHGLLEAIERDAWLIGQCNPYILPVVDYTSSANNKLKNIISKIKGMGYDIITRDYTNDLKIPVYRTWIVNRNDYSRYAYNGFGCHVAPEIALERSITEAVQVEDFATGGALDSDMITIPVLSNSYVNLYNQHFLVNKDILGKTDKITKIGNPIFKLNSSYEIIRNIAQQVKDAVGGDVYYVNLTKPGMNVKVARTVITGDIQKMNTPLISASKRMFEFGMRCGYSDKKTSYEELFMGNYAY